MRKLSLATVALWALCGAAMPPAVAQDAAKKAAPAEPVPAWLEAKIKGLTPEQREFLLSDEADGFAGSHRKLLQRLETKSPEEIAAYVDAMMSVAKAQKFNPATDMAAIPLNTDAPEFNLWKTRRPESFGPKREPGPITLNYY
ncbi:MAG: arginase, partial [Gammaproteobacteria bacterium]|nr:arginase [Gammaproteobacteria bacterium]